MAIPVNPLVALTDQPYLAQTLAVPPSARVQKPQELKDWGPSPNRPDSLDEATWRAFLEN